MKTRSLLQGAFALLVGISPLIAAAEPASKLDQITVTATRAAQTVEETLASVTVLTRADIERTQSRSVEDLLRGVAGLTISNNGGPGKATSFLLRGTESDHVLVLVDGLPLGSATLGTTSFQDLPLDQIERIELVRGPRSSLYGSKAIGGVIQIFTRRGGGPLRADFSVGGGSDDTWNASAAVSGSAGRAVYAASLGAQDTRGFNACRGSSTEFAGCFTEEPDDDGYENLSGNVHLGYRFQNGAEADLRWLRTDAESEFDGSFQNETETAQDVLGLHLAAPTIGIWTARLDGGQTRDDSENFLNGAATGRFDTKKNYASLLNELRFGERQSLILGADYEDDEVDSTTVFAVDSRDNTGLFAQYLTRIADVEAQASLRSDDNEQFGKHTTGGAGLGGALGGGLRWMLAYGTAFKAPTFNELYFPDFGNPDLEPEESQSLEAGLSGNHGWGRWTLNVFQNRVDELIGFDANFSPVNIDEARILGVETTLSGRLAGTDVATAYTWMDPENRADGSNKGKVLPRRARQSFRIDVDRALGVWRLGGTLRGEGKRYDDLANTRELGGYATLDLRAEIAFAPGWRLQLRGENLLDKQYETAEFFNQQDAAGWLTLRYQIGH